MADSQLTASDWRPVRGYEGRYEVSSNGDVRTTTGRVLGQWPRTNGYLLVRFSHPRAVVSVHRVVAEAFITNPERKQTVNHLDCNTANNRVGNLEWCTQAENLEHSRRLCRMYTRPKGPRSENAKLSDDQVRDIRGLYSPRQFSLARLGKMFSMSKRAIGRLIHRETYADV